MLPWCAYPRVFVSGYLRGSIGEESGVREEKQYRDLPLDFPDRAVQLAGNHLLLIVREESETLAYCSSIHSLAYIPRDTHFQKRGDHKSQERIKHRGMDTHNHHQ